MHGVDISHIVFGLLFGLVIGSAVSLFNFWLIHRATKPEDPADVQRSTTRLYGALAVRYLLDVLTMVVIFLLRNLYPFSAEFALVGGAVGLIVPGMVLSLVKGFSNKGA